MFLTEIYTICRTLSHKKQLNHSLRKMIDFKFVYYNDALIMTILRQKLKLPL